MRFLRAALALATALSAALLPGAARAAGFERLMLPTDPPMAAGLWYPTEAAPPVEPNTPFRQALALGADPAGAPLPLIVISHGDGGWMGGHAHTALALAGAGYAVIAPEHPGNNSEDESASVAEWSVSRPADITAALDHMLGVWRGGGMIDATRIGFFGFSAGGYTGLVAGGAVPDLARAAAHCASAPEEFVCRVGMMDGLTPALEAEIAPHAGDPRLGALALAAPGLGFAFGADRLAAIDLPVLIWSGTEDARVPHKTNGGPVAEALGAASEVTADAGHFAFMAPCNPRLQEINPQIWNMVCVDADGFDRAAFHEDLNARLIAFFNEALAP